MKTFWIVIAIGVGLVALSGLFSVIGSLSSQRSDLGVIAGAVVVIVIAAAATSIGVRLVKRVHGPDDTKKDNKP